MAAALVVTGRRETTGPLAALGLLTLGGMAAAISIPNGAPFRQEAP